MNSSLARPSPTRLLQALLLLIFFLLFTAAMMTASMPTVVRQGRDSGIFAYTAQIIGEGGVPYRDALDNKPPITYYTNVLAFKLFGVGRWALWNIEYAFAVLTGLMFYWLLMMISGGRWWLALPLSAFFVLQSRHPGLVDDGNFTESYALLFQVAGFACGYRFLKQPRGEWGFLLGLMAGLAFLTKQNTSGFCLTFLPALLLVNHPAWRRPQRWLWLGSMIAGGLLLPLLMLLYFLAMDSLGLAYSAVFSFPNEFHEWVSLGEDAQEHSLLDTVRTSLESETYEYMTRPLMPFFLLGLGLVAWDFWRRRGSAADPSYRALELWALATFLVDFVAMNITNRAYFHYFITPLPPLLLLLAFFCIRLVEAGWEAPWQRSLLWLARGVLVIYLLSVTLSGFNAIDEVLEDVDYQLSGPMIGNSAAEWVVQNTTPEHPVLVWGASTAINFQSGRYSPTNWHYAYPLIVPGYTTPEMIQDLLDDLNAHLPLMIMDTTRADGNRIPPLLPEDREWWWARGGRRDTADLSPLYDWVAQHCEISSHGEYVTVYECARPE